jgi:hypothetical protein
MAVPASPLSGRALGGTPEPAAEVLVSAETPGLLAALPCPDLTALERGLQQFLRHLGWPDCSPGSDWSDGSWRGWIGVGLAVLIASEIARRQLRRPAAVRPLGVHPLLGPALEVPGDG